MERLITTLFLLAHCMFLTAQDTSSSLKKISSIQGSFSDFAADNVGNIYLVSNNQQIKKVNENGDSISVFNDGKQYGKISSIDVTNPFKVLVFFKQSSTIVLLDRLLSTKQVIDLKRSNINQAKAIKTSYDDNIWLYDEGNAKIKKVDENGKIVFESVDLRNVFDVAPSFEMLYDDNNSLYFYDPGQGWFVFDHYGAFIKKYPFTNWKDAQVLNGIMVGRNDSSLVAAKSGDFDFKILKPFLFNGLKVQLSAHRIYVLYPGKLEVLNAL